jgi:glucans biosynthesis protein
MLGALVTAPRRALHSSPRCGAEGSGAQPGNKNAFKHGLYSAAAEAERRRLRALMKAWRKAAAEME